MSGLDAKLARFLDDGWYAEQLGVTNSYRYCDEVRQRSRGDICVQIDGKRVNIEEKANSRDTSDCMLELIQNVAGEWDERKTRGWFFDLHECDYLLHGYFNGEDVAHICVLQWKALRDVGFRLIREGPKPRTAWCPAGFGLTLLMFIPYQSLDSVKVTEWRP